MPTCTSEQHMKWKQAYYDKHRVYNINSRRRYEKWEAVKILKHSIPDIELAKQLGRSLTAIQIKRVKLKGQ